MPRNIKLIIFDWDDVFTLGSTDAYLHCYHAALVGVGVKLKPEEERARMGRRWGARHELILEDLLKDRPGLINEANALYEQYLMDGTFENAIKVVPETAELITRLAKNYTLSLVTGMHPHLLTTRIMPKYDIPNRFSQIITAYDLDDPTQAKPNAYSAQTIMKAQGIKPFNTIVVGDSMNDIKMGKNAGTKTAAVLSGHLNRQQAEALSPDYIIEKVTQIEDVLGSTA